MKTWYVFSEAAFLTTLQYRNGRKKNETRRATQAPTPMITPTVSGLVREMREAPPFHTISTVEK